MPTNKPWGTKLLGTLYFVVWSLIAHSALANNTNVNPDQITRGEYLARAGGCISCHTEYKTLDSELAGGVALTTSFGTFYTPNITPDLTFGIGNWVKKDFVTAMTQGISPQGSHYYPTFPYTAYSGITGNDLADLWAYLRTVKPSQKPNKEHNVRFPISIRLSAKVWKLLFFSPMPYPENRGKDAIWNRGAYLVNALGHCSECHTPRNIFGALKPKFMFSGTKENAGLDASPNITPDQASGIGSWSVTDLDWFLKTGFLPDGDVTGSSMADIIEHSTSHLTDEDRRAMVLFLRALRPIFNPEKVSQESSRDDYSDW